MVKIKYYPDPTKPAEITAEFNTVGEFLLSLQLTRDELLDLRFFDSEILGHEIKRDGGEFIDINDGTVAITHDSLLPRNPVQIALIVFAVVLTATILLMPKMPNLEGPAGNGKQQSATNRLGDTSNEPRINQRIDDIFGTVTKHVPSLWQVPYRIGVDNQETEVLFLCVGRGKYQIDPAKWYDGDTPVRDIPGAAVNVYSPNTHPGSGSPSLQIGQLINQPIGIYRQSNDLNPSELPPPNDRDTTGVKWRIRKQGLRLAMEGYFIPEGFDFLQFFKVGDEVRLSDMYYIADDGTYTVYLDSSGSSAQTITVTTTPVDIGAAGTLVYTVSEVFWDSLLLNIPSDASTEVVAAINAMVSYYMPPSYIYHLTTVNGLNKYTQDTRMQSGVWFDKHHHGGGAHTYDQISVDLSEWRPATGVPFDPEVGPIFVPTGADEVILNFVSASGFYKLVNNQETKVTASIRVKFQEVDANGANTATAPVTHLVDYTSNSSVRNSVFKTVRLSVPFERCKISAERLTNRDKNGGVSNVDNIEWRDLYSFEAVSVGSFGNATTAQVLIPSNSQSRLVKQRKQNVTLTRLITQYLGSGNFGPAESYATNDFDLILIHTMLDPFIGRMSLSNIAADAFVARKAEIISYFGQVDMAAFGYNFDTTDVTAQDTFTMICDVVMCLPYVQAGIYDCFFEKAQLVSSMQVTCRNKLPETEVRRISYDRKHDGVEVTYRSNITGTADTIYIPADRSATNPIRKDLRGCVNKLQAYRYGMRVYNKQRYQTDFVKFDLDEFGRNIIPGMRIDSPDSTRFTRRADVTDGYRVFDGEVIEVTGLTVELSEPVWFTAGEDHYITFTKENGDNSESILCTQVDEYRVLLSTLPLEPIYDGYLRDRTKFTLMSEQLKQSVALLPQTIESSIADDGSEVITVNSTNYSAKFYQNDLSLPE